MPEDQLVELEQALLLEQMGSAVAEQQQELKPVWHRNHCFRNRCCRFRRRRNQCRRNRRSIRQLLRSHMLVEPVLLHGELHGRSQPRST